MATLLAIDTATEACSAALWMDSKVTEEYTVAPRQHTRLILPMVDRLLAEAGVTLSRLDCFAFGRGPGAFTGVRLAAGVVQGLAFAADRPVVAISDLAALAQGAMDLDTRPRIIACLDARMNEVYAGFFVADEAGLAAPAGDEVVVLPAELAVPERGDWFAVGSGWHAHPALAARFELVLKDRKSVV